MLTGGERPAGLLRSGLRNHLWPQPRASAATGSSSGLQKRHNYAVAELMEMLVDGLCQDVRLVNLGIRHGVTTRAWGDMKSRSAREKVFSRVGVPSQKVAFLKQVHGAAVAHRGHALNSICPSIDLPSRKGVELSTCSRDVPADAWVLSASGVGCAVLVADCVPLFMWDSQGEILGLAHVGWRGAAQGLPGRLAGVLTEVSKIGTGSGLSAFIGPHIQACCYDVGPEVAGNFPGESLIPGNGNVRLDLAKEVERQLKEAGLEGGNISRSAQCTFCNRDDFFSFRRDKGDYHMMAFLYKYV